MTLHHLAPTAWHAFALTEFQSVHTTYDDRPATADRTDRETATLVGYTQPYKHADLDHTRAEDGLEPRHDLIPVRPLALLAEAYGTLPPIPADTPWSSLYARIQEHAGLFWGGEDRDRDGILHTVHIIRYCLELLAVIDRPELDDRLLIGAAPIGFDSSPA